MVSIHRLDKDGNDTFVTEVKQSEMTSECWMIQFMGLEACEDCEFLDTEECGGKNIRETLLNEKGFSVPLGESNE